MGRVDVADRVQELYSAVTRPNTLSMLPPRTTSEGAEAHKKGAYVPPNQRAKDDKESIGVRRAGRSAA